jgi:hypothetical protein
MEGRNQFKIIRRAYSKTIRRLKKLEVTKMLKPRIEQISLEQDIKFVRGMELNFEQEQFSNANKKVIEMLRNPIPNSIRING